MSAPQWASVDDDTADLLTVLAEDRVTQAAVLVDESTTDPEWDLFVQALARVTREHHGRVSPNHVRPLITGQVPPRRVGPFYRRACLEGLLLPTQDWDVSDDTTGRNSGRPVRVYAATALMPPRSTQ